jgi:hypothetical protein
VRTNGVEVKVFYDSPEMERDIHAWLNENSEADLRLIVVCKSPQQTGRESAKQPFARFLRELEMLK